MQLSVRQSQTSLEFSLHEIQALAIAKEDGWLTLTREVGDRALEQWQDDCARYGRPFAVVRPETTRVSIWFVLAVGREWSAIERGVVTSTLADAKGFILSDNAVRAFVEPGMESRLMRKLTALTAN